MDQEPPTATGVVVVKAKPTRKVFKGRTINKIPLSILNDEELNLAIKNSLPDNYNFEIHKTIWKIRETKAKRVAIQMPEGKFLCKISIK